MQMLAVVNAAGQVHLVGQEGGGTTATTTAEEHLNEPQNPILPETSELVWAIISFGLLVLLLWKFAFPPLKQAMEARTERIRTNLDDAERVKSEAQQILDEYQHQLADARNESNRIIEEARQTAESLRRDLMVRAEAEVAELRQRSADEIQAAKDRALADLRAQVANIAVGAAEKIVERSLDRETNIQLVENYINSLEGSRS